MKTKLSYSAIRLYRECPKKYKLHYIDKIRPITLTSAIIFGSSLDEAFNVLLQSKDLSKSKTKFIESFTWCEINKESVYIPTSDKIIYFKSDLDNDLLDIEYNQLVNTKDKPEWHSLKQKGLLILDAYYNNILPQFQEIKGIQKVNSLTNTDGDQIITKLDFIAKINDKWYLMDNKTTTKPYNQDRAYKSAQLNLYSYVENINGIGYAVSEKKVIKPVEKICSLCGKNGTGQRHLTCDNVVGDKKRCGGSWNTKALPFKIKNYLILSSVNPKIQSEVVKICDEANTGIKNNQFDCNYNSCTNGYSKCVYYDLCYNDSLKGLVKVGKIC